MLFSTCRRQKDDTDALTKQLTTAQTQQLQLGDNKEREVTDLSLKVKNVIDTFHSCLFIFSLNSIFHFFNVFIIWFVKNHFPHIVTYVVYIFILIPF